MESRKSLIDEFEDSFSNCTLAFTKQMSSMDVDKEDIKLEVDQTTMKFIDLARQMENFFLQKRCLLSKTKPELLLKEENADLRHEITRKDEQIKKHLQKINKWKEMLSDQTTVRAGPEIPGGPMQGPPPQRFPMPQQQMMQQQMMPNPQGMFVPNQNMPRPNFPPQIPPGNNNPLAFLESISKTTNNIDMPPGQR